MQMMMSLSRHLQMALGFGLITTPACSQKPQNESKNTTVKQYQLRGEIKGLDPSGHVATIRHENIPGFMKAMTMGYPVRDAAEFSHLKVGEAITATVYVKDDDMWVGNIKEVK